MVSFEELRAWLDAVRIVHHIPGRVRLKLVKSLPGSRPSGVDAASARGVPPVLEKVRGIRSLRVNLLARSCTIEYDPRVIPGPAWDDLLAGRDTAAAQALDGVLHEAYQEVAHALEPR